MKWVPSTAYTLIALGLSMLIAMFFTGVTGVVSSVVLDYNLSHKAAAIAVSVYTILIFGFLICIPEDTEV